MSSRGPVKTQAWVQRALRLNRDPPAPAVAGAVALGCVLVSTLLRLALDPVLGSGYSFMTYFLAVIAAGALAGFLGALVALALSLMVAWYLFVPPQGSFAITSRRDALALVVFAVNAGLSGLVAAVLRRTLARLTGAEERQELLIHELNHRVKNTLAAVQSLALHTMRTTPSYEDFQARLTERLRALAAAHDLLTRENWEGAELGAVVREVLRPYERAGPRITAEGPEVTLSPNAAVTTSMALHEMATNAAKHGALRNGSGRLDVRWGLADGGLDLEWRESGVAGLARPAAEGFGTRLLQAAARELHARVETDFTPDGLHHRWRVPLSEKVRPAVG